MTKPVEPQVSLALRRHKDSPLQAAQLADELGLSPKRFNAAIEALARQGFSIESHPILGLRLAGVPESMREDEIAWDLPVARVGRRVRCVDATPSTNDLAWEAAEKMGREGADGLAVFAEHQSAGRGRRGNRWLAPPHTSILCSTVLWMPPSPSRGGILTRAAAVAVAEAIEDHCRLGVGIKWPNDLVVDDRKVGGILVEGRPITDEVGPVVIGIGVNCTQGPEAFPPGIRPYVASLRMLGENVDRTLLARSLLERLDRVLASADEPKGLAATAKRAADRCMTLGRLIALQDGETTCSGEVVALDPDYGLVLRLQQGGIRRFPALTSHVAGPAG